MVRPDQSSWLARYAPCSHSQVTTQLELSIDCANTIGLSAKEEWQAVAVRSHRGSGTHLRAQHRK